MTRISALLFSMAVALTSQSFTAASPAPLAPAMNAVSSAVTGCTLSTPEKALLMGRPYEIHFKGCKGHGTIQLRSGPSSNLVTEKTPACASVDFSVANKCVFTPMHTAQGLSFSTIDASRKETFSARFAVVAASAAATAPVPAMHAAAPMANRIPSSMPQNNNLTAARTISNTARQPMTMKKRID